MFNPKKKMLFSVLKYQEDISEVNNYSYKDYSD